LAVHYPNSITADFEATLQSDFQVEAPPLCSQSIINTNPRLKPSPLKRYTVWLGGALMNIERKSEGAY
jgi:hypothetical protein